jgi:Predicted PP-loop superfamily ATPase
MQYILSVSGGLDSAVLCAVLIAEHGAASVLPVFFRYGSKHNPREERSAHAVAAHYGVALTTVDLSPVFAHLDSALLAHDTRAVPQAPYDSETMRLTVVPGRNLIFASILAAFAENLGGGVIALATHAGDHALYPDCRPSFNASLERTVSESSGGAVRLTTPFSAMDKIAIVARGMVLRVPFHLTRSCYESDAASCGRCGTCMERLSAFASNNIVDPIEYFHCSVK